MTPRAARTRCTKGCGKYATKGSRCEDHQRIWENKSANTKQLSSAIRQKFRREQLAREPACRVCGSTDTLQADHITEIADGGSPLSPDNGQTLCEHHHEEKSRLTARLRAATRRHARG